MLDSFFSLFPCIRYCISIVIARSLYTTTNHQQRSLLAEYDGFR